MDTGSDKHIKQKAVPRKLLKDTAFRHGIAAPAGARDPMDQPAGHGDVSGEAGTSSWEIRGSSDLWVPEKNRDDIGDDHRIYHSSFGKITLDVGPGKMVSVDINGPENGSPMPKGRSAYLMLEQHMSHHVVLHAFSALIIHMDLTIDHCDDQNPTGVDPHRHQARLFWDLCFHAKTSGHDRPSDETRDNIFLFRIPIFDCRHDFIKSRTFYEKDPSNGTRTMVYSMGTQMVFGEPVRLDHGYTIDMDVLPYLREAYVFYVNHHALKRKHIVDMELDRTYLKWEMSGDFNVKSTFQNIDVEGILT